VLSRLLREASLASVASLVGSSRHTSPWSLEFSQFVVRSLPTLIKRWQYAAAEFVRRAELRLDPAVLPEAERLLETGVGLGVGVGVGVGVGEKQIWLQPTLERLVESLAYRQGMRQDFGEPQ
jgi:hypothetical protein